MARPTPEAVDDQIALAMASQEEGTRWPGMSYEDGVVAALNWAMGDTDEEPMEE